VPCSHPYLRFSLEAIQMSCDKQIQNQLVLCWNRCQVKDSLVLNLYAHIPKITGILRLRWFAGSSVSQDLHRTMEMLSWHSRIILRFCWVPWRCAHHQKNEVLWFSDDHRAHWARGLRLIYHWSIQLTHSQFWISSQRTSCWGYPSRDRLQKFYLHRFIAGL